MAVGVPVLIDGFFPMLFIYPNGDKSRIEGLEGTGGSIRGKPYNP